MKRTFLVLFSVITLWSVNILPASAQFTLLPQAPEGVDCKNRLDLYEVKGWIPNQKDIILERVLTKSNDYDILYGEGGIYAEFDCEGDEKDSDECKKKAEAESEIKSDAEGLEGASESDDFGALLGCAIKTGRVSLQMIPHFISFFANFLLAMSGLVSVLFIVIGGFMYIYGGLTDQKEKGKKYIYNALFGMVLALMAWTIVSVIIAAVTS